MNTRPESLNSIEQFDHPSKHSSVQNRIAILEQTQTPFWIFDVDHSNIYWSNEAGLAVWNAESLLELRSRNMSADMSPAVTKRLKQYQIDFNSGRRFTEHWTFQPKGKPSTYIVHFSGIVLDDGRMGMLVEVPTRVDDHDSLTLRSTQALMHTSVMISMYDENLKLCYCNPAARAMLPDSNKTLEHHLTRHSDICAIKSALEKNAEHTIECLVRTANGDAWHQLNFQLSPDSVTGRNSLLVSEVDITKRRVAEQQAHSLAYLDVLTGLPNRTFLNQALDREINAAKDNNTKLAVMFVDLNRFKLINDSLGHSVGDEILKSAARLLKNTIRKTDTIARLGGDEFLILMPGIKNTESATIMATRLTSALTEPVLIGNHELTVSSSIGISIYPDDGEDSESLMKYADVAMYRAKEIANDDVQRFDAAMFRDMKDRLQLEVDMRKALTTNQFELYFQPRVSAKTNRILCAEALIRWNHPEQGVVSPGVFIPIAEETGLIVEIGNWVLEEAIRQCSEWKRNAMDLSVSINVSSRQFNSGDLAGRVLTSLSDHNCPAYLLELEITESMLVHETNTVRQTLNQLQDTGVQIAIDDFGTGYSNLAYLQEFPINKLKIDRSFIMNEAQRPLVEMIVSLGKMLNVSLVAEGIETHTQANWLKTLEVDEFQGYLFAKPLTAKELNVFYHEQRCHTIGAQRQCKN